MSIDQSQLEERIEFEIRKIRDPRVVSKARALLVKPYVVQRDWDYGAPGITYPCWSVLEHPSSNIGIAYCESGFGPRSPWGLVFLTGSPESMSIGMDCGWFQTFEEAFFDSQAAVELPIWRVFKREAGEYPGTPLTPEADWESTWAEVYRLREHDKTSQYNCGQSIQVEKE